MGFARSALRLTAQLFILVSAGLFFAVTFLFARSWYCADNITYGRGGYEDVLINSREGRIEIMTAGWLSAHVPFCGPARAERDAARLSWDVRALAAPARGRRFIVMIPFDRRFQF